MFTRHLGMSQLTRTEQDKYIAIATGPLFKTYQRKGFIDETDFDILDVPETDERAQERSQRYTPSLQQLYNIDPTYTPPIAYL